MEIEEEGSCFVVPCREWAAVHLDRHIRYSYGTKRNALRAANDKKRNLVTTLCYYSQCLYERVAVLETILLRIKKATNSYDFDDADSVIDDGGSAGGVDTGATGSDSESRDCPAGTAAGDEGTDGCAGSTDTSSSWARFFLTFFGL